MRVAVVGGGLAGLTVARDLAAAGAEVTVFEAADRWGGKIFSSPVGLGSEASSDHTGVVDAGPDNFLARVPDALDLCAELGLSDQLTQPVSSVPAYFYRQGSLHRLPLGTMLGVPTDFAALGESGLISPAGIARAEQDLTLAPTPFNERTTVGEYCRARLGEEVTDVLVDPLVGGINASSVGHLALREAAPQLWAAASRGPSLVKGLRAARPLVGATLGSADNRPVFHGLNGGMATLIDALVADLNGRADLRLSAAIQSLPSGFDRTVLATPASVSSRLLSRTHVTIAGLLGRIRHGSVAQLTLRLRADALKPLDASGILVPRAEGLHMTACTWFSTKWEQYSDPESYLLRLTSGRFGDDRVHGLSNGMLRSVLLDEYSMIHSDPGEPMASRIVRWPDAFPQYQPGHSELVDEIEELLSATEIGVVGNAYRGIGIPATIRHARTTAAALLG